MPARKRKLTEADKRAAAKVRALWADFQKKHPGISQESAAGRIGITQSAFSQFVLGRVPMRVDPVMKFAQLFDVAPTEIRDDLVDIRYSSAPRTIKLTAEEPRSDLPPEALEIAELFKNLSPQTREIVRGILYMYSVVDKNYPSLRAGQPERRVLSPIRSMATKIAQEAARQAKPRS